MIKVFNYPWHIAHNFELVRIPDTRWSWLEQPRRQYSARIRDDFVKEYVDWVPYYEEGKYDVALLHLDQQAIEPALWDRGKGSLFRQLNEVIKDIPKIVIMHGTPYYPEMFSCDITEENYESLGFTKEQVGMSSELIKVFKEVVKDVDFVIFNSHTAQKQWGFEFETKKHKTIWHGMGESEWWDLPKEPRVVTMISPAGLDKYYGRSLLRGVREILQERDIIHCHITVDTVFANWDEYRNFMGRSLIYFNPTLESPMPRSRTEAMLSGQCVVTTKGQDAEMFIESGENGIIVPKNPRFISDVIEGLIYDYTKAIEIGQKGKQTAKELFTLDRYYKEWHDVFKELNL